MTIQDLHARYKKLMAWSDNCYKYAKKCEFWSGMMFGVICTYLVQGFGWYSVAASFVLFMLTLIVGMVRMRQWDKAIGEKI